MIGNSRHRSNTAIRCKLCADMMILALAKLSSYVERILPEFEISVKSYSPGNEPLVSAAADRLGVTLASSAATVYTVVSKLVHDVWK